MVTTLRKMLGGWGGIATLLVITPHQSLDARQQGSPVRPNGSAIEMEAEIASLAEEHFRLGLAYLKSPESSEKAVEHLEKAAVLNRGNAEYHFKLAEAYARDFSYANILRKPFLAGRVRDELVLAVQFQPSSIEYREGLIQYYVMAPAILGGSYTRARGEANAMSAFDPYFSLLAHANINAEEGDHQRATALFMRAIAMRPGSWQGYQRFGTYCVNIREIDRAIQQFKMYVNLKPDTAASHESLASSFVRKRMYDEAIASYLRAYEVDASQNALLFRIAQLHEFKGSVKDAIALYAQYIASAPSGRLAEDARARIADLSGN
ncbi:MAG: tetratricopeptide repeat protein [Bacteroidota bacterium]